MKEILVLDSWAVLAWLQGEKSGAVVKDLMRWAEGHHEAGSKVKRVLGSHLKEPKLLINIVNVGEVWYLLARRRGEKEAHSIVEEMTSGVLEVVSASDKVVWEAARFKMKYSIAYADAFAAATANLHQAKLVSGDPELRVVKEISLLWLA